jgi:hypothetical protein
MTDTQRRKPDDGRAGPAATPQAGDPAASHPAGRGRREGRPSRAQATFALRLDPAVVAELRDLARVRDVGPTQLVRSWVLERLELEHQRGEGAGLELVVDRVLAALRPRVDEAVRQVVAAEVRTAASRGSPAVAPSTPAPFAGPHPPVPSAGGAVG